MFDDRLIYYDLHNEYFHTIPYLRNGHFCFGMRSFFGEVPYRKLTLPKNNKRFATATISGHGTIQSS